MILGARKIILKPGSLISKLYGGLEEITERQRHRYEVNEKYIPLMEQHGCRMP